MHFANSDHERAFEIKNCEECAHNKPDDPLDCPLKLAKFFYNGATGDAAVVLDYLQHRVADHDQIGTCLMRIEKAPRCTIDLDLPGHKLPGVPSALEPWTHKDHARVFLHDARRSFERRHYMAARKATAAAYEELVKLAPLPTDGGNVKDSKSWPIEAVNPAPECSYCGWCDNAASSDGRGGFICQECREAGLDGRRAGEEE